MNVFLQSEGGLCLMIMIPHGRKSLHQSMMGGWGLMERWISLLHYGGETRDKCVIDRFQFFPTNKGRGRRFHVSSFTSLALHFFFPCLLCCIKLWGSTFYF